MNTLRTNCIINNNRDLHIYSLTGYQHHPHPRVSVTSDHLILGKDVTREQSISSPALSRVSRPSAFYFYIVTRSILTAIPPWLETASHEPIDLRSNCLKEFNH